MKKPLMYIQAQILNGSSLFPHIPPPWPTGVMEAVPERESAYQKAHVSDFNAGGLSTFCISGEIIVLVAVILRVYSPKLTRIAL